MSKNLLPEIERQKKYLSQLPEQFSFPLFNSKRALESQRESGYRNTAAAAREIVDNSIEAQASKVHVVFNRPVERKARQRKNSVAAVAFIDDGSGMLPSMARYALSWGGGTHFDDSEFIGKFGFGLPNASVNQTRRVELYTRTSADTPIHKVWLDIDEYTGEGTAQEIKPPEAAELPDFVQSYLDRNKWTFDHGTIVVWDRPDRLSYRTDAALKEHLLSDFGATYRYLLKDFELVVEGVKVEKVDPLFLDPGARFYRKPSEGGAEVQHDAPISVKLIYDPETGERHLVKVNTAKDLDDPSILAAGSIHIRVARFPLGFAVGGGEVPPIDEYAKSRFEIRKSRRGMSFVRAGREIETVDAFPRRASDIASGLGEWPLLQAYAYHWGIEVLFTPSLDTVFGITNDKQTVRPIEDFWRLLADEEIDTLLHRENAWQSEARRKAKMARETAQNDETESGPSPAEAAARAADFAAGEMPVVPDRQKPEANLNFERQAQENAKIDQKSIEEARKALDEQQKAQPYLVELVEDEHGPFYTPVWVGKQIKVQLNTKHPFYETLYASLRVGEGHAVAKYAVDLLLIALAREELRTRNPVTADFYREQRTQRWTPWLATALRTLSRQFEDLDEEAA